MSKTRLWDKLCRTDPGQTKSFKRAGGFSGTAIKPMWSFKRMTEEFGPCGEGWGMEEPSFQTVAGNNGEVLVYCTVQVWWKEDITGDYRSMFGVGGDKVVTYIKANDQYNRPERWENDDEAFKKAYTDAIGNALKLIGVGADVHMGMFDDSKYVNEMKQEFAEEAIPRESTFQSHYTAVETAPNMKALETAFLAAKADKTLTARESQDIIMAKNIRKDRLSAPASYVAPDFDNLSKDAQEQVKLMRTK